MRRFLSLPLSAQAFWAIFACDAAVLFFHAIKGRLSPFCVLSAASAALLSLAIGRLLWAAKARGRLDRLLGWWPQLVSWLLLLAAFFFLRDVQLWENPVQFLALLPFNLLLSIGFLVEPFRKKSIAERCKDAGRFFP